MPEQLPKICQSPSPVARSGAGDISERELSRERQNLQTTPPANRLQPAHPKKQLFSVPVSKFTASTSPGRNLVRLRSCLHEYQRPGRGAGGGKGGAGGTPARSVKSRPKAVSMEDLTPTKRVRRDRKSEMADISSPGFQTDVEQQAAARVCRFLMLASWRRRRDEVRCLRRTLECQLNCSERLRMQVSALKSLLDSDNAKVRLAMKELERLKHLLRDKEAERALLEREKFALEHDVCAAEDKASEMSIGWRNCRNELEGLRTRMGATEHALSVERAAAEDARSQRDHALHRLKLMEEDLTSHEELLTSAEEEIRDLRRENEENGILLRQAHDQLHAEHEAREQFAAECASLRARVCAADEQTAALRAAVGALREETARLRVELRAATDRLQWWPRAPSRMVCLACSWLRGGASLPAAVVWWLLPARLGTDACRKSAPDAPDTTTARARALPAAGGARAEGARGEGA